jgi:hypothetical protein
MRPLDSGRFFAVLGPVVFDSNPWYYLYAFVALVSLLTRLTRLPGRCPTAFFLAGQASGGTK